MASDLQRILDDRFVALVASSQTSSVAFASSIAVGDLEACSALVETWHGNALDTPLVITSDEFRRSLDAFPAEYQAIVDRHVVIAGLPPFGDVVVDPEHLRRACEVQANSLLIHLRQGWIESAGRDDRLAALLIRSAGPLRALLANVSRLGPAGRHADAALEGAHLASLPDAPIAEILALERAPEHAHALVRKLPEYLAAAEHLWAFVDRWRT